MNCYNLKMSKAIFFINFKNIHILSALPPRTTWRQSAQWLLHEEVSEVTGSGGGPAGGPSTERGPPPLHAIA